MYNLLNTKLLLQPAMKLGQGNIFRSMCQEFCPRGDVWADTPLGRHPSRQTPPRSRHPSIANTPRSRHPLEPDPLEQCTLGDTVNKQVVRILLDCILVSTLWTRCTVLYTALSMHLVYLENKYHWLSITGCLLAGVFELCDTLHFNVDDSLGGT